MSWTLYQLNHLFMSSLTTLEQYSRYRLMSR